MVHLEFNIRHWCRLSTTGLLLILSLRFPKWYFAFLLLISLDIFSHWLQMYSSLVAGDISHKVTTISGMAHIGSVIFTAGAQLAELHIQLSPLARLSANPL